MPGRVSYDYAVVRVVPRVEREEFVNVGVILSCPAQRFLRARIELDEERLLTLAPDVDIEEVRRHLDAIVAVCDATADSGPIAALDSRQRFHWMVAPRSTMVQMSAPHAGLCLDAAQTLDHLVERLLLKVPSQNRRKE